MVEVVPDAFVIRAATPADWPGVWDLFRDVAAAGDVFAYDEHTPEDVARKLWFDPPVVCFVAGGSGAPGMPTQPLSTRPAPASATMARVRESRNGDRGEDILATSLEESLR